MGRPRKAEERREQIIRALYQCLAKAGHETVTVKDIAANAGMTHGSIHYYFKTKDDIVIGLAETLAEEYADQLTGHLKPLDSPKAVTSALLDFAVDELVFNRELNRVFYNLVQMAFQRKVLAKAMQRMLRRYRGRAIELFQELGIGEDSRALGYGLVAVIEGLALQWMIEPRGLDRERVRVLMGRMMGHLIESSLIAKQTGIGAS
jgi:AcrR family transcriptional regulator